MRHSRSLSLLSTSWSWTLSPSFSCPGPHLVSHSPAHRHPRRHHPVCAAPCLSPLHSSLYSVPNLFLTLSTSLHPRLLYTRKKHPSKPLETSFIHPSYCTIGGATCLGPAALIVPSTIFPCTTEHARVIYMYFRFITGQSCLNCTICERTCGSLVGKGGAGGGSRRGRSGAEADCWSKCLMLAQCIQYELSWCEWPHVD